MSSLDLRIKRDLRPTVMADLMPIRTEASCLAAMIANSGLQDKSIALDISVDAAQLSKVQSGQARLGEDKLDALMDVTGSELWLDYWLMKRGYDPLQKHRIKSDLEIENDLLRGKLAKLESEREVELRLIRDIRVAA